MPRRCASLLLALAACLGTGLASAQQLAEPEPSPSSCSEVIVGLGYLSRDALRYGRYRGQGDGSYGVLAGQVCSETHPGEDGARWWYLRAQDLGLRNNRIAAGVGEQGRWSVRGEHRRQRSPRSRGLTPLQELGETRLTLPADWQSGANTVPMTGLQLPQLNPVAIGVQRRSSNLGLALLLPQNWQLQSRFRDDRRDGLQRFAGLIGSTGGNARAIILPAPIDQRTREMDTALVFAGERLQLRVGSLFSQFDNRVVAVQWQNPFAGVPGWSSGASYPGGFGQAQLAPDNRASQISLSAAWRVSDSTQAGIDVAVGRMTQNQAFLPYTIDPQLAGELTVPLPSSSLNGRVDTRLLQLRLAGRPHPHWRWTVNMRHDDRDNRTPVNEFIYVPGDAVAQNPAANSSTRRFNLPYDYRNNSLRAQLGYRPTRRVDISARLDHSDLKRSVSARASNEETGLQLQLRSQISGRTQAGVRLSRSERSGGSYIGNRAFLAGHASDYTDGISGQFENLPELRQYHLADRDRERAQLFATFTPSSNLTVSVDTGHSRDHYSNSELGLQSTRISDAGFDLGWALTEHWTAHGYARRDHFEIAQRGRAFQGGANRPAQSVDPERNWDLDHRDQVDSFGIGLRRPVAQGRLGFSADLSQATARGRAELATGAALSSAPLPDTRSTLRQLDMAVEWRLSAHTDIGFNWRHERLGSNDWAYDGTAPNTLGTVILLGENSPSYSGYAFALTLRKRF